MPIGKTEVTFDCDPSEVSVLDGYCSAKGIKRPVVLRWLLREWSIKKHRESIMIVRVAGDKQVDSGYDRTDQISQIGDL